jgi:hypothetical protein
VASPEADNSLTTQLTRRLLQCGIVVGPVFIGLAVVQMLARPALMSVGMRSAR